MFKQFKKLFFDCFIILWGTNNNHSFIDRGINWEYPLSGDTWKILEI